MNIVLGFIVVIGGIAAILGAFWMIGVFIEYRIKDIDPETYIEEHREKKQRSIWRRDINNPFTD
jgi:formylmethanofuran dehydrogenase subunit C